MMADRAVRSLGGKGSVKHGAWRAWSVDCGVWRSVEHLGSVEGGARRVEGGGRGSASRGSLAIGVTQRAQKALDLDVLPR